MCSDIVFLNDMFYGECLLIGEIDIFIGEYIYIILNLEVGWKYYVYVKFY